MPRPRNPPTLVSAFAPELLGLLLKGATERVEVPMPWRVAHSTQSRINYLRAKLQRENHEAYPLAARCKIRVELPPGTPLTKRRRGESFPVDREAPAVLIAEPQDRVAAELIRKAGVDPSLGVVLLRPDATEPPTSHALEDEPLESFLERAFGKPPSESQT